MIPVQLSLFERDGFGACVGVPDNGTSLRVEATETHNTRDAAARAGLTLTRNLVEQPESNIIVYDPREDAPQSELGEINYQTDWSGAPSSSIVDHFASYEAGDWTPPFSLEYGRTPPEPPYRIYTDGTYTPPEHQDSDRTTAGVGFVVAGSNEIMYACGAPTPHVTDSLDSEYYAILSALMTVKDPTNTTVYTDHRNVPDIANGVAPERCAHITDRLIKMFEGTPNLTINSIDRSATRLADGLATAGTRTPVTLGTPPSVD